MSLQLLHVRIKLQQARLPLSPSSPSTLTSLEDDGERLAEQVK